MTSSQPFSKGEEQETAKRRSIISLAIIHPNLPILSGQASPKEKGKKLLLFIELFKFSAVKVLSFGEDLGEVILESKYLHLPQLTLH